LIVEDEMLVCRGLKMLLDWEKLGFSIDGFCSDGLAAQRQLEMAHYDLVLCDIHIPGINGLELIHWMREKRMNTEVIVISAYAEFEYARRVIADDVVDYLLKPIDEALLESALGRVRPKLEQRAARAPHMAAVSRPGDVVASAVVEMHNDCGKNCSLESLAKKLYVSSSQLNSLFRKRFGLSVKEYINQVRMERAEFLLSRSEKMVYQIAQEVGFQDIDYFTRLFKQHSGLTPSAYRRRQQESPEVAE